MRGRVVQSSALGGFRAAPPRAELQTELPNMLLVQRTYAEFVVMAQESGRKKLAQVKCPACRKQGDWFAGSYGPFCSRRCKLVDLGKWFSEEHAVSEPLR